MNKSYNNALLMLFINPQEKILCSFRLVKKIFVRGLSKLSV